MASNISNVHNNNGNNIRTVNNTFNNTVVINTISETHQTNIEDFIAYIKNNQPEWFKESEWVEKRHIEEKYMEMYDEHGFPKAFWLTTKNRLYTSEGRPKVTKSGKNTRPRAVLLNKYVNIYLYKK